MGWIEKNIVQPIIDALLKDENLAKLSEGLAAGVTQGILNGVDAQGDRIINNITTHTEDMAEKVITEVAGSTEAVGKGLSDNINNIGATIITEINSTVNNLFTNIKNLFPHIPGLNEPPPRPRGRR